MKGRSVENKVILTIEVNTMKKKIRNECAKDDEGKIENFLFRICTRARRAILLWRKVFREGGAHNEIILSWNNVTAKEAE